MDNLFFFGGAAALSGLVGSIGGRYFNPKWDTFKITTIKNIIDSLLL